MNHKPKNLRDIEKLTERAEAPELKDSSNTRRFPLYCETRDNAVALLGEDPNAALAKAIYESSKD